MAGGMPVGAKVSFSNEQFPLALFSRDRCERNHRQTPERLAERGGLVWSEAAAIIENRKWQMMDPAEAEKIVRDAAALLDDG